MEQNQEHDSLRMAPRAHMFEYLVDCLERMENCDLIEGGMSLGVGFEFSKA